MKYPTSTKKPVKDWDRLEAEAKKEVCLMPLWTLWCFRFDVIRYWLSEVGFLVLDLTLGRHL